MASLSLASETNVAAQCMAMERLWKAMHITPSTTLLLHMKAISLVAAQRLYQLLRLLKENDIDSKSWVGDLASVCLMGRVQ